MFQATVAFLLQGSLPKNIIKKMEGIFVSKNTHVIQHWKNINRENKSVFAANMVNLIMSV